MPETSLEKVLELFFESNPAPFCIFDPTTLDIEKVNSAWKNIPIHETPTLSSFTSESQLRLADRLFTCFRLTENLLAIQATVPEKKERLEQLEALSNRKSELISHLSHELRTPLTAILGWPEMILDAQETMPVIAVQAAEAIQRDGKFLNQLLESLLDLSQIESGRLRLQMEWVDLRVLAKAAVNLLEERMRFKQLDLLLTLPETPVYAKVDSVKIRQAMLNYISNAVKYTPEEGKISVELTIKNTDFVFSVSDTGRGLRPEVKPHVFERYVRAEDVFSIQGTGIGLALVKKLLDLHSGKYWVESDEGQGSSFFFSLPMGDEKPLVLPEIKILCLVNTEQERLDLAAFFKHHPVVYKIEESLPSLKRFSNSSYDLVILATREESTVEVAWQQAVHTLFPQQVILAWDVNNDRTDSKSTNTHLTGYDGVLPALIQVEDLLQYIQKRRD